MKEYPLGIMDLAAHENKIVLKQNAVDMYDAVFVTERVNGELALHTTDGQLVAAVNLPESALGRVHASAVSADLNYLAVSTRTRGAIWDISRDARVFHTRRFNAVGLDGPTAYTDFPKFEETPREIGELRADSGRTADTELKDEFAILSGTYLVVTKAHGKDATAAANADLEVRDVRTNRVLWSHYFPKDLPAISVNTGDSTMLMRWAASSAGGHAEIEHYPDLKSAARDDYICDVLDATSGSSLSHFVVKTNGRSVRYWRGTATHSWAVMEAMGDQIITYALPTGEEKGHFFGSRPVLANSGLLAVESDNREITVYDLRDPEARQQYTFAQPIALKAFSVDSQRMLVFTTDQSVYLLDVANSSKQEPSLAVNPYQVK